MHALRRHHPLRTMLAGLVLVALVSMQSLGLLHRIVHAGGAANDAARVQAVAGERVAAQAGGWLEPLFAGHDQHGCDAFDQLTHTHALCSVPALPFALAVATPPPERHHAWQLAHQAAGFLARGPPALS